MRPSTIMEIGVWNGLRGREMIQRAQKHSSKPIKYFGLDLFEEMSESLLVEELSKIPPTKKKVEERLVKAGAEVTLFAGNTLEVLPRVVSDLPQMDFVFIDGGHAVETIKNDWECVAKCMHKDTVVLFDDYYPDREDVGAKSVVDAIDREKYVVSVLPEQDVFKKKDGVLTIQFAKVTQKEL